MKDLSYENSGGKIVDNMDDASLVLFNALSKYSDFDDLIGNGEAEGLHLECKAPSDPRIGKDLKNTLAQAVSGFSNTAGGVIVWGVSTVTHAHSGLDVLTQIEPIGQCSRLSSSISTNIPTLTTPPVLNSVSKTIKKNSKDTQGIVVTHIPKHIGDPVQTNGDTQFYFRSGDAFIVAPYEMIQRLFLSTISPDLHPSFYSNLVELKEDGFWEMPIIVENRSSAVGQHVLISVEVVNPSACDEILGKDLYDASKVNPGKSLFHTQLSDVVHREMDVMAGLLRVKMKVVKRAKRLLRLKIKIYAHNMRAREIDASIQLAKNKFSVQLEEARYLY